MENRPDTMTLAMLSTRVTVVIRVSVSTRSG
jgi:hypothetical protein